MKPSALPLALLGILAINTTPVVADSMNEVRLFEHYFTDAVVIDAAQAEGFLSFADFDNGSVMAVSVRGDAPVSDNLDIGARLGILSSNPDFGSSETGLSDLAISARFRIDAGTEPTQLSAGIIGTLPTGNDDVGQDNFNLGGFFAARHPIDDHIVVLGIAGLNSIEIGNDRELSLHLGGGAIFKLGPELHLTTELSIDTEEDYSALTGGADYALPEMGRLRAAITLGLDDGAADLGIQAGYLLQF